LFRRDIVLLRELLSKGIVCEKKAGNLLQRVQGKQTQFGQPLKAVDEMLSRDAPYWSPQRMGTAQSETTPLSASQQLKTSAAEWVPGASTTSGDAAQPEYNQEEALVEVEWNGESYVIPESLAGYDPNTGQPLFQGPDYADIASEASDPGLAWAQGSLTLPAPPKRTLLALGLPENIRQYFSNLDLEALRQLPPDDERLNEIPARFTSVWPLDEFGSRGTTTTRSTSGHPSALYKVLDRADGALYALRRFDNVRTNQAVLGAVLERWSGVRHPGLVWLHSAAQDKGALFFTHAYHASAATLSQRFLDQPGALLAEPMLWRMLIQLLVCMRHVHRRGLAIRSVSASNVLLTSGTRFRFSNAGVMDVLEFESRKKLEELQADDLVRLGLVVLSVAARVPVSSVKSSSADHAIKVISSHFGEELQVSAVLRIHVHSNTLKHTQTRSNTLFSLHFLPLARYRSIADRPSGSGRHVHLAIPARR
jgi:hypothetical protein